ncbi:MAG: hypothetical protein KJ950_08320 [Proteobacteria bacterium]|nr:hypothetical protein [Pseudomonadota bacterium]MBU1686496.1 hypothetical protein [Pseudomonadota bacterium]
MLKKIYIFLLIVSLFIPLTTAFGDGLGIKKKNPKPHEFGDLILNNFSTKANRAPVLFRHWLHRAKYTCRLCHVDIGFSMRSGETGITESDNENGLYCGSCHNEKEAFGPTSTDTSGKDIKNCDLCHRVGKEIPLRNNFYEFRKTMPRERFGNGIDWIKAEEQGLIKLKDYLENISIKRPKIDDPAALTIEPHEKNMPEIIFSHEKHAKWSGCELCHPDIFGIKKGAEPYTMQEIFDGKYCGLCHGPVAFPNMDCQRCHTKLAQ